MSACAYGDGGFLDNSLCEQCETHDGCSLWEEKTHQIQQPEDDENQLQLFENKPG